MRKIKSTFRLILIFILRTTTIKRNYVFFSSFHGQYSGDPKYISEALYKTNQNLKFFWEISAKSNENNLPKYIIKIKPNTLKALYIRSRSGIITENYLGWISGYAKMNSLKYKFLSKLKKCNQLNISTWHGTPIKMIGQDNLKSSKLDGFYSASDILVLGNKYCEKILTRVSHGKIPIEILGSPRNDILVNKDILKSEIITRLKLPANKKILLYAPTFRIEKEMSGIKQIMEMNIKILLERISKKFSNEWIFVFRVHDSILQHPKYIDFIENNNIEIYSGNIGDDMAEYLYVSDLLVTDYSSVFFDYALTYRPCFLYCPDLEDYTLLERGLYINIENTPFPLATTYYELIDVIDNFDEVSYRKNIVSFLDEIGTKEEGNVSQLVVTKIEKHINKL